MDNNEENKQEIQQTQEFDLNDIMSEFSGPAEEAPLELTEDMHLTPDAEELLAASEEPAEEPEAEPEEPQPALVTGDTIRLDDLSEVVTSAEPDIASPVEEPAPGEPREEIVEEFIPAPIPFRPKQRLKQLKKKLIAGPEKRYYDLSEQGVGKLQVAIFVNILIVLLCAGAAALYVTGGVTENRLRLLIFSQLLAMLVSALLGCYALMDGVSDLLHGRFSLNTMMVLTFVACCIDAGFCLKELRVPCCAAFSLEMTMSLWNRYEKRSTEMGQMDTMRKATRLDSLVKVPDYYDGRPGLLRGEGQVEDFMDHYEDVSGPEKLQWAFSFISFLLCIGIAVLAGLRHGVSMAFQIFATSLLVASPASFFVALSRPMAVLERRLHMVGTVLCGWRGVKGLSGKAAFPLTDSDLFPVGSTKLNGVKFYNDRKPEDAVAYAAALMEANGGSLAPVFRQLLKSKGGYAYPVENFRSYPAGGIGGEVCKEPVLLGTLNFLQDMGVEIPEGTMVNQAVYCSIDGQLCAVFAISYGKLKSSAAGVVSLSGCRKVKPVMLVEDFMLNESFLRSKFSVNTRRYAFPEREARQELAQRKPGEEDIALALTTQDGLAPVVYAVTGARALQTATRMGMAVHMFAGILGMLIMAALAYIGDASLLTPVNILLYQLTWMIPGLLVTSWTRTV